MGTQLTHNLTAEERIGMTKLQKRVKEGEITIIKSDKGNQLTVSSIGSYTRQGDVHTEHDNKISVLESELNQQKINTLCRSLGNIFNLGANGGDNNASRCWANLLMDACVAPTLCPSPETHKPVGDNGDPKSRPIIQASSCITSRSSEIVSDILEAALLTFPVQHECKSTEDMLAKIDEANVKVQLEGVDVCVGSGDVVALYPSIQHKDGARQCAEMIRSHPAEFNSVDVKAVTNCSPKEIKDSGLQSVIPARHHKKGTIPMRNTPVLTTRQVSKEEKLPSKFNDLSKNIMDMDIRNLIAKVLKVSILMIMNNHVYSWKGELWLQTLGVPTGLRVSGIIAKITMDSWKWKMTEMMEENKMKPFLLEKYVDDSEIIIENIPMVSRWDDNIRKIVTTEETAAEDREAGRTNDEVTMKAWGSMTSCIIPGITFTVDYPDNNANGKVPMLDFMLWKEREDNPENPGEMRECLKYSFYEKPATNPKVMDAESAMPQGMKIATLTQEGVHRLCNSSRELPNSNKCEILTCYMRKLQRSGYGVKSTTNILQGAIKTFRRK